MSGLLDLAHSRIAAVEGYRAGRTASRAEGKLSSNESGLGAAPSVRAAIAASLEPRSSTMGNAFLMTAGIAHQIDLRIIGGRCPPYLEVRNRSSARRT